MLGQGWSEIFAVSTVVLLLPINLEIRRCDGVMSGWSL